MSTGGKEIIFIGKRITGENIRITTAVPRKDVQAALFNAYMILSPPKEVSVTPPMKELISIQDETDSSLFSCTNVLGNNFR